MSSVLSRVRHYFSSDQRAVRAFHSKRFGFYRTLITKFTASAGLKSLPQIFEDIARDHAGRPLGRVAAIWVDRWARFGGDLGMVWHGTLPAVEVSALAFAQNAPDRRDFIAMLGRVEAVSKQIVQAKKEAISALFVPGLLLCVLLAMVSMYAYFGLPLTLDAARDIPKEKWHSTLLAVESIAGVLQVSVPIVVGSLIGLTVLVVGSLDRWTGKARNWADEHLLPYQIYRTFTGALALSSISLMSQRSTVDVSVRELMLDCEPWLQHKLAAVASNIETFGQAEAAEAMDVGLMDPETYITYCDAIPGGQAMALECAAEFALSTATETIRRRVKGVALVTICFVVLAMVGQPVLQMSLRDALEVTMKTAYASS